MRADARGQGYVEFVTARQTHLRRIAYAISGDWHQADDLLQTALTKLYVAWPRLERRGTEEAYVRRIIVRASDRRAPARRASSPAPSADRGDRGHRGCRRGACAHPPGRRAAARLPRAAPGDPPLAVAHRPADRARRAGRPGEPPPALPARHPLPPRQHGDRGAAIRPVDRGRPHTAAALLSIEGVPAWVYAAGSSAGHLSAPEGGTTLADWAQQQLHDTTTIAPGHTYADNPITREHSPVAFDGDRLVAKPGATITERIDDPAYSSSAIPSSCTARAAAVTDAGTDLFVLGYTCPHGAWDLFTETAGPRADSLPAWLAAVKAAQDGGEGVR